ncbi:MAG: ABC transporter permease subunit [Planctomycetota bacterium]|jgi:microcin C transport system permease protein
MHGMTSYFIRRILLIPVTFICITFMVYTIMRTAPGGPIEQAKVRMMMQAAQEGGGSSGVDIGSAGEFELPEAALEQLRIYYKLDKSIPVGYMIWLGVWPDDHREGKFSGILQGDFGISYRYSESVLATIVSKFPISIYFGVIGYFLTWLVCIPLGITKALKHRTIFDTASSLIVFIGYSIPGFVAALVLMLMFATSLVWDIFPFGGFRSENWSEMWGKGEIWWCIKDQVHHTVIPVIGYMIASFAAMTMLMKNSLLDNLGADYVRTAFAKGLSEKRVIYMHALRNSLIPLCVGIGHAIGLLFAGSFLIERTCNIPGMGLLGYMSLIERDYPVLLGILVFGVLLRLTGNLLSDMILALVDPRVRFK